MKSHFLPLLSLILLSPFHLSASDNHQGIYDSESEDESSDQSDYFFIDNNNPNDIESNTNERENQVILPKGSTIPILEMTPNPFSTPIPPQNNTIPHIPS